MFQNVEFRANNEHKTLIGTFTVNSDLHVLDKGRVWVVTVGPARTCGEPEAVFASRAEAEAYVGQHRHTDIWEFVLGVPGELDGL